MAIFNVSKLSVLVFSTCTLLFSLFYSNIIFAQAEPDQSIPIQTQQRRTILLTPEEQAWLDEQPEIVLGAPTSYPPFVIKKNDGTHVGVLIDYYKEVSRLLNHRIRIHIEDPWVNVQEKAENREIDGLALGGKAPHRAVHFSPTDTVFNTYYSIFARSKDEFDIKHFSDLDGMRIGFREGGITRNWLKKLPVGDLKPYNTNEALTQALLTREVDVVVSWISYDFFRKEKLQGTIDNILLIEEYPVEMVTHIRKDWPELVSILNKTIIHMQHDSLPRIMNKWFIDRPTGPNGPSVSLTPKEQAWLRAHPEITLGTSASYPPHVVKNLDGTYTGVLPDLYEQISKVLDSSISLHIGKVWIDVQKKAQNKDLDGLAIGGRDPKRDALYSPTHTIYPTYFSVFANSTNDFQIQSFSDLDGMRIGYKRGAIPAKTRLETLESAILMPYDSHESMTQAMISKDIDVIVAWMSYDHWRKTTLQGTIDKVLMIEEFPLDMVIYVRKDWPELVPIINKAIAVLQQDELPRIINKWFGEWPQKPVTTIKDEPTRLTFTDQERSWLVQNHQVRVRVVDWPPYLIVNENEPPQGIVIEYLKLISERSGVVFKYEVTDQPFAEFLDAMKEKQGPDMTAAITPTPERKQYLLFSEPYFSSPFAIFTKKQDDLILDISAFGEKSLAITRGTVIHKQVALQYPDVKLVLFDSDGEALRSLATGQVDGFIGSLTVASYIINRQGFANLQVTAASPFGKQSLSIANRNDWPELTSIVNKALANITEEEITGILTKFLSIKYEQGIDKAEVMKWIFIVGGAALSTILLVIIWNRQLSREIGKRMQTEHHLKKARDDAETANRAKSIFLANMSHELRTPLNAILGFSRILARKPDITVDHQDKLTIITHSGEHLLAMINDVLDISKVEAGRVDLETEVFDLKQLLSDVGKMFELRARKAGLDFEVQSDPELVRYIRTDSGKLRQILFNLLSNAVNYTAHGGIILRGLSLPFQDDPTMVMLKLEVEDNGCGIPPDLLEHIFAPFCQVEQTQISSKGTGLGLAISKSFVELMGGTISVDSKLGKGSLFRVELPVAMAEATDRFDFELVVPSVVGVEPGQPSYRILVVEDNHENRLLMSTLLNKAGFEIREAVNGEEAIELFQQWQPHFIWMDIRMPVLDGYETTRQIRDLPGGEKVKIVAITAGVLKEQESKILLAGCDKVVHKPFKDHEIYETMAHMLNIKYLYQEKSEGVIRKEKINLTSEVLADLPGELLQELREKTLALNREAALEVISIIAVEAPDVATGLKKLVDNYQMDQLRDLLG